MPPEKQNQPWYKKHPLLAGLGAAAIGGGGAFLGDKLLNGGKLTSQLLDSTKPAGEPSKIIPQATPEAVPAWMGDAEAKWNAADQIRDYKGDVAPAAYSGGIVNDTVHRVAGSSMLPALGTSLVHDATGWLGKNPGRILSGANSVAGRTMQIVSPLLDAQTWSENPSLNQANAEFYNKTPEEIKYYMGGAGATAGALINTLPGGAYIDAAARTIPKGLDSMIRRSTTDLDATNMQGQVSNDLFKRLIVANKDNDIPTLQMIKNHFPLLGNKFNEGSKMRDTINSAFARQQ